MSRANQARQLKLDLERRRVHSSPFKGQRGEAKPITKPPLEKQEYHQLRLALTQKTRYSKQHSTHAKLEDAMQEWINFLFQHSALSTTFVLALCLVISIEWIRAKQSATALTPLKATQLINHHQAIVIDIRPSVLYEAGHIIKAITMAPATLKNNKKLEKFRGKPIILVCQNGIESQKIATLLNKASPQSMNKSSQQIVVLAGGMQAWLANNLPIQKTIPS